MLIRRQQDLPDGWKKMDGKRARPDLEDEPQDVKDSWYGQIDMGAWMDAAEGICLKAGNLRSGLERDGRRVASMGQFRAGLTPLGYKETLETGVGRGERVQTSGKELRG